MPPQIMLFSLARAIMLRLISGALVLVAAVAYGIEFEQTLQGGDLWQMSPGEVWQNFFLKEKLRTVHRNILISGKERRQGDWEELSKNMLVRSFWFWEPEAAADEWAASWADAPYKTVSQRLGVFKKHSAMRAMRVSTMLYRRGSDGELPQADQIVKNYTEQLSLLCGSEGQEQPMKNDAAGRNIKTWIWEHGKTSVMLESATVKGNQDYIRLTFAPDQEKLYYKRTGMEHAATAEELRARVTKKYSTTRLEGFPVYTTTKDKPYTPGWFTVLCYYGYHDIDNYCSKLPKQEYPGSYTELSLRDGAKSKKKREAFERAYRRDKNLNKLDEDVAEETYVQDNHAGDAEKWWDKLTGRIKSGTPIIYSGRNGFAINSFYESVSEKYACDEMGRDLSAEHSYLLPNSYYIILPGKNPPPQPAEK